MDYGLGVRSYGLGIQIFVYLLFNCVYVHQLRCTSMGCLNTCIYTDKGVHIVSVVYHQVYLTPQYNSIG